MTTRSSAGNVVIEDEFPMLVIGRDHRVSYANHKAHTLLGYEHGTLSGISVEQVLAPSRRKEVRNVQAVLRGEAPRRWQSAARAIDGTSIEVNLSLEPCLDDRGQVVAVTLRCERILRARRPSEPSLNAVSGLRLIAHPTIAPAPMERTALVLNDDGAEQLETALQLLGWLRQHLEAAPTTSDVEESARERARTLAVLNEATELVAQCRCESQRAPKPTIQRA